MEDKGASFHAHQKNLTLKGEALFLPAVISSYRNFIKNKHHAGKINLRTNCW